MGVYRPSDIFGTYSHPTFYRPHTQACCSGVLYDAIEDYTCCDRNYVEVNSSITQVCCGGRLHTAQSNHQCCGEQYLHVPVGSICCETGSGNPQIGMGTACCGGSPYVASADVVCCGGTMETNHVTRTCCGGQMVSISTTACCEGIPHALQPGYSCCGQQYISPAVSLCCMLDDGNTRVCMYVLMCVQNVLVCIVYVHNIYKYSGTSLLRTLWDLDFSPYYKGVLNSEVT